MSAATLAIPRGRVAPPTFWARLRREVRRYPIGFL